MKFPRSVLIAAALVVVSYILSPALGGLTKTASAFHDGGVGYCEGCHSMHNNFGTGGINNGPVAGKPVGAASQAAGVYLLLGSDASSTCLNCHSKPPVSVLSADGSAFTPGGDFFWLTEDVTYTPKVGGVSMSPVTVLGQEHGHNVIAADFGLTSDTALTVAPGSTIRYPASALACNSCHDPHGQANGGSLAGRQAIAGSGSYGGTAPGGYQSGNYRLLGDRFYTGNQEFPMTFACNAPVAVSVPPPFTETSDNLHHTDYGYGMSEWCANCHDNFLNSTSNSAAVHRHPAGVSALIVKAMADIYNSYVKSGNFSGNSSTSYLSLVPFERGLGAVLSNTSTAGPSTAPLANSMCLSCHRAHASAFQDMTRWDTQAEFLAQSHPATGDKLNHVFVNNAPYYGRDIAALYGNYQRTLCNKCHGQD
ncbi:MAG: hypothetical protein M0033_00145 [Nitrospiraceae bacterium]|nr:hypothetical protein [Nitrospiraceae bacterium]